uniref:Uncharacterized protein n=1 Tax=Arundo donax TaxID=35708 RepID=A0A0A9A0I6_ARUDO
MAELLCTKFANLYNQG